MLRMAKNLNAYYVMIMINMNNGRQKCREFLVRNIKDKSFYRCFV